MKIGIDARFWQETGVGRYIRNLVEELQAIDKNNSYTLFIRQRDKQSVSSAITEKNWNIVIADVHWHSLKEQIIFKNIVEKEKLDLVHFPYFSMPVLYQGKYVVTIHDLILHHFPTGEASTHHQLIYSAKLLGYNIIMKKAAKSAAKIIAVSESTKDEIKDHLHIDDKKIIVTYEGFDQTILHKRGENEFGRYFLHVGNVYPHKNCKRLVDGFLASALAQSHKLIFVGKEDYFMHQLREYAGNNESVLFLHSVDDKKLSNLYQHAVATVVPSLMEGFGLPVVEAMANKCLVVAANIPSLREVSGSAAFYCNPTDTVDIAQKLEEVENLSVNEKQEKINKGLELAKRFSWKKMAKETLAIYESCNSL